MTATHESMGVMTSARDDYPLLADAARCGDLLCSPEAWQALDELDELRRIVTAVWAWRRCRYAQHANTSEASRKHHESIRFAEGHLSLKFDEFIARYVGETR